ncbi:glucose dehydrogenase [Halobacteriales archaeon QS_1_67_19]|nr:MAG: glucose dehydrogenase [Halobacteriales archaeon QS_1_67_19]
MDTDTFRRTRRGFLAAIGAAGLAGCGKVEDEGGAGGPTTTPAAAVEPTTPEYDYEIGHDRTQWEHYDPDWASPTDAPVPMALEPEVLVENLEIPWDLAFAPTGELFVTERTGRIHVFEGGDVERVAAPDAVIDVEALPPEPDDKGYWETWFVEGGEGGMLGVAVHPAYPDAPFVYVYFTAETDDGRENRVVRFDVAADDPAATAETVVEGIPADAVHNGGRIAFGPENYLWITTGDAGDGDNAQDTSVLAGSVLRVDEDGDPAPGNPDLPGADPDPRIYTYGHRNPQCITWLPDATPIITEHGTDGLDEVNLLEPGANYGWPDVRRPEEYEGSDVHPPLVSTEESWAPSGGVFYTSERVSEWRNRLVFGSLFGQRVNVVTLSPKGAELAPVDDEERGRHYDADWHDDAYAAAAHWTLTDELGRIRHVKQGPDGHLYAITSNRDGRPRGDRFPRRRDDVLVRLTPAE